MLNFSPSVKCQRPVCFSIVDQNKNGERTQSPLVPTAHGGLDLIIVLQENKVPQTLDVKQIYHEKKRKLDSSGCPITLEQVKQTILFRICNLFKTTHSDVRQSYCICISFDIWYLFVI